MGGTRSCDLVRPILRRAHTGGRPSENHLNCCFVSPGLTCAVPSEEARVSRNVRDASQTGMSKDFYLPQNKVIEILIAFFSLSF